MSLTVAPPRNDTDPTSETSIALYRQLVNDATEWDMPTIARELNVKHQTVKSWRSDSLANKRRAAAGDPPHPNVLPLPKEIKFGKPIWAAGEIRKWAMQTGRMTPEGSPCKPKPPGRPRGTTVAGSAT